MTRKVIWDLCSGLGGWTQAFVESENWEVYSFEINEQLIEDVREIDIDLYYQNGMESTIIADVTEWKKWAGGYPWPDVITCSPPCTEFSTAYNAPRSNAERDGQEWQPDMTVSLACKEIIDWCQPEHWIVENVYGSARYLEPVFGPTRQAIRPWIFYGKYPGLHLPVNWKHTKNEHDVTSTHPYRANIRGMMPYQISLALKQSVEDQWSLERWT